MNQGVEHNKGEAAAKTEGKGVGGDYSDQKQPLMCNFGQIVKKKGAWAFEVISLIRLFQECFVFKYFVKVQNQ